MTVTGERKKEIGRLGGRDGKSSNGKSIRGPGECFLKEKMMQSLVIENFMRVIGTHILGAGPRVKVLLILKKSNGNYSFVYLRPNKATW
jgi:hypothetical protein